MLKKKIRLKMTKSQKEAVSEGLAMFFFDYFQSRQNNRKRNNKVAIHEAGFPGEDFPTSRVAT